MTYEMIVAMKTGTCGGCVDSYMRVMMAPGAAGCMAFEQFLAGPCTSELWDADAATWLSMGMMIEPGVHMPYEMAVMVTNQTCTEKPWLTSTAAPTPAPDPNFQMPDPICPPVSSPVGCFMEAQGGCMCPPQASEAMCAQMNGMWTENCGC